MAIDQNRRNSIKADRGKYRSLFRHLCYLDAQEWEATFGDVESVIGFRLPASARRYRAWWANQNGASSHVQANAWIAAGWEVTAVDLAAETVRLRRTIPGPTRWPLLDKIWPPHPTAVWPEGLSLRREDMYADVD